LSPETWGVTLDARAEMTSSDDALNLQASLADLARIVTGTLELEELMTRVAVAAARAVPRADGAGVTLLRIDRGAHLVQALAASAPFVREIDEIQYVTLNEGPCITAAIERRTMRSGLLGSERRWPRFGPRVERLGVHSVLSLPLLLADEPVGTINVYARERNVFDDHASEIGELFAPPAAVAVHNAQVLTQAVELTLQLQAAIESRPVIDQAIGLIRGRTGVSADAAFDRLRALSQADNVKLSVVAQRMVDDAVRRARARNRPPT
jgi:GAF domain-containing protein